MYGADVSSRETFLALQTWLADCRALASPDIVIILVGNKSDVSTAAYNGLGGDVKAFANNDFRGGEVAGGFHREREVSVEEAGRWASREGTPVPRPPSLTSFTSVFELGGLWGDFTERLLGGLLRAVLIVGIGFLEASALEGTNVEEAFLRCARQILTKVELGPPPPPPPPPHPSDIPNSHRVLISQAR